MLPLDAPLANPNASFREALFGPDEGAETSLADLEEDMYEAEIPEERTRLAQAVLRVDPEHIEAHMVLAEHAATSAEAIALLREAVRIGKRTWGPAIDGECQVDWWRDIGTKPFMRAIMAYGDALAEAGRPELAARCYWTLLTMQPEDSLGAREELKKAIDETCHAAATFAR